jgi:hypothetical protein
MSRSSERALTRDNFRVTEVLPVNGNRRSEETHTWKQLYATALCELNAKLLLQKIADAQQAIDQRAFVLVQSDGDCDAEKQDLVNAHRLLNELRRIYGLTVTEPNAA